MPRIVGVKERHLSFLLKFALDLLRAGYTVVEVETTQRPGDFSLSFRLKTGPYDILPVDMEDGESSQAS